MTILTVPQISTPSFYDFVLKSHPTGSSYTCDPPVTTTDIDTIILADTGFAPYLMEEGWMPCSGEQYTDHASNFSAWRKGNLNYIVTTNKKFYKRWVIATKIAKAMNLLDKAEDRKSTRLNSSH